LPTDKELIIFIGIFLYDLDEKIPEERSSKQTTTPFLFGSVCSMAKRKDGI